MTAPALDRLRDEIEKTLANAYSVNNEPQAIMTVLTRHIPAGVLAGLLDGTMVAVPREPTEAMLKAAMSAPMSTYYSSPIAVIWPAMLAAAKQEDRA